MDTMWLYRRRNQRIKGDIRQKVVQLEGINKNIAETFDGFDKRSAERLDRLDVLEKKIRRIREGNHHACI